MLVKSLSGWELKAVAYWEFIGYNRTMKEIRLTKGKFASVDDQDFEELSKFNWYLSDTGYAIRNIVASDNKSRGHIRMHRYIIGATKGLEVDHIDENKLNNTRANLRVVSRSINMHNRASAHPNTSGYRGVCFDKSRNKWIAYISVDKRRKTIGRFTTKEEAAEAYNQVAQKAYPNSKYINHLI